MSTQRSILKSFIPQFRSEGVGAQVRRSIGVNEMRKFSPFVMLDHFNVKAPAGFEQHPHHGQETITLLLDNYIAHEDFTGSKGILRPGDLQFMTAGKGVVHSEIPVKMTNNDRPAQGMQLWVALPEKLINCEPRYRDLRSEEIPIVKPFGNDDLVVKIISGESYGVKSVQDLAYTPVEYYQFNSQKSGTPFKQFVDKSMNTFIYVKEGSINIAEKEYPKNSAIFFKTDGDLIQGSINTDEPTEFFIIAGQILDQDIVQYGPFIDTSEENIYSTFRNYQLAQNGFENIKTWKSVIDKGVDEELAKKWLAEDGLKFLPE
ncbi:hypothetical protein QEN19_001597 [Hanseniaspora menglaensis]